MVTSTPSRKLLERCSRALREGGLLPDQAQSSSLPEVVRSLIVATSTSQTEPLTTSQIRAWAATLSDLTSDRSLAVEALRLGILPALPRFLQLHKTSIQSDISWSDGLIALHNFALLEEQGFPEALEKLEAPDLAAIATNLARALKAGLHPIEARDAAARLAIYEPMMGPLIDAGVLTSLTLFLPSVKPLNRLPQWGLDSLREINNSLHAMDALLFIYTKTEREEELPTEDLANSNLTGWICDVLQGAPGSEKYKEDVEQSRISALECLTSLLINATVCRQAVPNNRSMLFRVASAITSTSSVALLSAAAQVLAQALSEEDLVQPSELASLHTYDLVRHLSQVVDESRDFRDLLNVIAALQNILDPAHFKGNVPAMKKVAERLVMCSFEEQLSDFLKDPKQHFDTQTSDDGLVCPTPEDLQALEEAGKGALENTRTLLQAVGPISVAVVPRAAALKDGGAKRLAGSGARKGAQNVPADVIAAVTGGAGDYRKDGASKSKRKADGPAEGAKRKRAATALPVAERVQLEKEMRQAASLAAPLLSGPPLRAVLEWFNEWGSCRTRLEAELGTDVHVAGGGHRVLLQDAIENSDPKACLDLLADILLVRLPPLKEGAAAAAAAGKKPAAAAVPKAESEMEVEPKTEVEAGPAPAAPVEGVAVGQSAEVKPEEGAPAAPEQAEVGAAAAPAADSAVEPAAPAADAEAVAAAAAVVASADAEAAAAAAAAATAAAGAAAAAGALQEAGAVPAQ